jgi:hypothetical protein
VSSPPFSLPSCRSAAIAGRVEPVPWTPCRDREAILIIDRFPWTRATKFTESNATVLPVKLRYKVTGAGTGCAKLSEGRGHVRVSGAGAAGQSKRRYRRQDGQASRRLLPDQGDSCCMGVRGGQQRSIWQTKWPEIQQGRPISTPEQRHNFALRLDRFRIEFSRTIAQSSNSSFMRS